MSNVYYLNNGSSGRNAHSRKDGSAAQMWLGRPFRRLLLPYLTCKDTLLAIIYLSPVGCNTVVLYTETFEYRLPQYQDL